MTLPLLNLPSAYQNCTVLVTGGLGFIGSHLALQLAEIGADVFVLDHASVSDFRLQINPVGAKIQTIRCDISDVSAVTDVVARIQPKIVFHLAAYGVQAKHSDLATAVQVNTLGAVAISSACATNGVQRLVMMGSGFEYDPDCDHAINESTDLTTKNFYGATKIAGNVLSQYFSRISSVELVIARLFATFGPTEHPSRLVPYIITSTLLGKEITTGTGKHIRDYLYVSDVVAALLILGNDQQAAGQIYNVGSGQPMSVLNLIQMVCELLPPVKWTIEDRPLTRIEPMYFVSNNAKLLATGWKPEVTLQDGVRCTIDWYRNYPQYWRQNG